MLLVVVARDGFTFLMAWEAMSLTSFFLVMFDHEKPGVLKAGWIYLITTHIGTAFLFVMFLMMGSGGTLDFSSIIARGDLIAPGTLKTVIFIAAVIGFGTKAGFVPVHIWLPEAHPAAPSHVSAVMSGVMIKTGIYGLLRVMMMLGQPAEWWGWTLIVIGALSGILGILFALAQHDLKRLLAYSSIENIGIITMAIGIGVLGVASHNATMATCGFAGALLHIINHGIFKSLLFLGAGSILHATGTREIDRLGGLMKRMPVTGLTFLVGATAICGLPPLNGFVSEFMVYLAAFTGASTGGQVWAGVLVAVSLALIGGVAVASFTKTFGVVFQGEPRSPAARNAHESTLSMRIPMLILAAICVLLGLASPLMLMGLYPTLALMAPGAVSREAAAAASHMTLTITVASAALIALIVIFAGLRDRLLRNRTERSAPTWDCGYAMSSTKVQYTASSFAEPIVLMFKAVLRTDRDVKAPHGLFPLKASLHTVTTDGFIRYIFGPAVRGVSTVAAMVHGLQQGRTHLYLLYIFATIIVLMAWNLR
jgi:formate hydrogenlyase subunit 3/multisubunit Na+/H+ antiporter MnhD subunit